MQQTAAILTLYIRKDIIRPDAPENGRVEQATGRTGKWVRGAGDRARRKMGAWSRRPGAPENGCVEHVTGRAGKRVRGAGDWTHRKAGAGHIWRDAGERT
ncbi:hypothetical protein BRYFOR_05819 [Marvinbryantia formatexigens DSM 14469]|uniref:Uncharacterized protein n=1 Tax=Marvinbryantia formatexigens DSM 14469 TaxID=478749 RepID=C6LB24_9FIRM|nr:hypothetical protein [Marvinbryantia formatexigens]EET62155.1 hypothetical protein BRYFOR_05819 [Marvinbryantia formatexigens DSM 14469]UWO26502.1 hypothetical protein NQ534_08620 [Marvinbryantia formatexigens DSM 14469]